MGMINNLLVTAGLWILVFFFAFASIMVFFRLSLLLPTDDQLEVAVFLATAATIFASIVYCLMTWALNLLWI